MSSVVLLSGGVDSALTLAMEANDDEPPVEALTFHYGQRHSREIQAAMFIAAHYRVPWRCITLDRALFETSSLTGAGDLPERIATAPDSTYVPARNTAFIALAAARAESLGADTVVIGCNADDALGYPDCTREYVRRFDGVLEVGTVNRVALRAPLIGMTKAEVLDMAVMREVPIELTWSCYSGGDDPCGVCGACQLIEAARALLR